MPRELAGRMFKFRNDRCSNFVSKINISVACHITSIEESTKLASKQLVQMHFKCYNLVQPSINSQP